MNLDKVLATLVRDPNATVDVAEIALELARDEYPNIDVEARLGELAGMAHEARAHLRGSLPSRVAGLCRYLFHDMGFRGNRERYYDPRNSYLNQVLERRTGIPISLTAVAMAVGSRAGLEIVGVGLPGHFVAKAVAGSREVLFDAFHGGRILTAGECEQLVARVTGQAFTATTATFQSCPPRSMVQRMLNNLKAIYLRTKDYSRASQIIQRLRQLAPDDPNECRDLGVCFMHVGRPEKAIDLLEAYLANAPPDGEAEQIRQLLKTARTEVARWN